MCISDFTKFFAVPGDLALSLGVPLCPWGSCSVPGGLALSLGVPLCPLGLFYHILFLSNQQTSFLLEMHLYPSVRITVYCLFDIMLLCMVLK